MLEKGPDTRAARVSSGTQQIEDQGVDVQLARLFDAGLKAIGQKDWARARSSLAEVVRLRPDYSRQGYRASVLLASSDAQLGRSAIRGMIFIALSLVGLLALTFALSLLPFGSHTGSDRSASVQQAASPANFTPRMSGILTPLARGTVSAASRGNNSTGSGGAVAPGGLPLQASPSTVMGSLLATTRTPITPTNVLTSVATRRIPTSTITLATGRSTNTRAMPTKTRVLPTTTRVVGTHTPVLHIAPPNAPVFPTNTHAVPTSAPSPHTATATPAHTPVLPTEVFILPTVTHGGPDYTHEPARPTATAVPRPPNTQVRATSTSLALTSTRVVPTSTAVVPTDTVKPTETTKPTETIERTDTIVPPETTRPTNTVRPTRTPHPTRTPTQGPTLNTASSEDYCCECASRIKYFDSST